ncbi:MAG: RNA polymerase sigma factor [Gammaproteobacteria bacterium]|uniref:DNA-directed RNA polymerase sigma-70 factor n=1 Tax=Xanthomonas boreopolis TaxID=86183 RepID=A0A919F5U6_9XANT|nr:RNA polymerase sigma factor [Pseudomonas sp. Hp2]GHH49060.1 DNA-directed RNA polymerase sigma-70 factor [[Pseudomonas] boreopolis]
MSMQRDAAAAVREGLAALLPRLRRFARVMTGNVHDADDLVQAAIERALRHAGQWRPEAGLEGWLFGIVRNAWIDEVRARQRRQQVLVPEQAGEHVGDDSAQRQDARMTVQAAMARLPEDQRMAVALVLVEGLSYREAAEILQVPVGTLTSRLARGRDALQALLGEETERFP